MEREKMYETLHYMRACARGQYEGLCDHRCQGCMYRVKDEEIIELLDTLIAMYRPRNEKRRWFRWHR